MAHLVLYNRAMKLQQVDSSHCNGCDIGMSNKNCVKFWAKREFPYDLVCTNIGDKMCTMTSHTPNTFGLIRCVLIRTICTSMYALEQLHLCYSQSDVFPSSWVCLVLLPMLRLSQAVVCAATEHSARCSQDLSDHPTICSIPTSEENQL